MKTKYPIKFTTTPLMQLQHENERKNSYITDKKLYHALETNVTREFIKDCKYRVENMNNLITSIYAPPGFGKSTAGLFINDKILSKFSGIPFTVDNICFTNTEMGLQLKDADPNECYMLDEQIKSAGVGSGTERQNAKNVEETVRKMQINFTFISPSLHAHEHHYVLRVWDRDDRNFLTRSILYAVEESFTPVGFVITGKPDPDLMAEYEIRKDRFIKKVLSGSAGGKNDSWMLKAEELLSTPPYIRAKTLKDKIAIASQKYSGRVGVKELDVIVRITTNYSPEEIQKECDKIRNKMQI